MLIEVKLVYVIGLHAVQFVNDWMKENQEQPSWTRPQADSYFAVRRTFSSNYLQIGQACSPLSY